MLKKIYVLVLLSFCFSSIYAQSAKFGYINSKAIFESMPENKHVLKEIEELQAKYESEEKKMVDEYEHKVSSFLSDKETLEKNIAEARAQEIEQLQQRLEQFRDMAAHDLQEQQKNKVNPIIEKITNAIRTVGNENNFVCIFDISEGNAMYISPTLCEDCTPLVKKELGL